MEKQSKISGFYKKTPEERLEIVKKFSELSESEIETLRKTGSMEIQHADKLIENVISTIEIPLGIATNFIVNGKEYLVPMAVEEPSVIAACSNAARIARERGGFRSESSGPVMIGQIQIVNIPSRESAIQSLMLKKEAILRESNTRSQTLSRLSAGAVDMEIRTFEGIDDMIVVHIFVDVRDAMGANVVNSMCEHVAPIVEDITGGRSVLRILSNLSVRRVSRSRATFPKELIGGTQIVRNIVRACELANIDPYRAATHNKGIMNGIDAVILATMNDWRSVEANAHTYGHVTGNLSLTKFEEDRNGDLVGSIEIPLAVGTVGGTTGTVEKAKISRKILGVENSTDLANVLAAVGLAQNFAALRALCDEGIQRGHMSLHARNIALEAGARPEEVDAVVSEMIMEGKIDRKTAETIVKRMH
ncbi:MAG: hydroxymethylglutaryl-CoA reductase, degradative [Candidatus Thermoplasmatota archaeon]|jgi:hydroxymethylglutaryl-CoA reductase|nr:hydroxymethylglutaryl-CoA reductase, degradative [Candidatus Thermoplasmatota archaeon]